MKLFRSALSALSASACLASVAIACGGSANATSDRTQGHDAKAANPGSIEGDVYLLMANGDTKRGTGRTIFLLRNSDSLQVMTGRICDDAMAAVVATGKHIKAITDSARAIYGIGDLLKRHAEEAAAELTQREAKTVAAINAALLREVVDTIGTGVNAHYRFSNVPPGKYLLFGEWAIGDNHYRWLAPAELSASQSLRRDLDNSAEASEKVYCGIKA